ncbi:MAG: triose-phosphate isomerase [bacterium]|nr:triose-phosphate isomerase [bacterium]
MKTIIINFKTYESATGENAIKLAKVCEKVAKETKTDIMIAVQAADIYRVSKAVSIKVLAQHIDNIGYGKNTGCITPESVKQAGGVGTILNHAEHYLEPDDLMKTIKRVQEAKLFTVCCAADALMAESMASYSPDYISVELPELIGTGTSVSTADPELVKNAVTRVHHIRDIPVLCGAGISTEEDVRKSIELGTEGVLLSSAVTKSKTPEKVIRDLAAGLKPQ